MTNWLLGVAGVLAHSALHVIEIGCGIALGLWLRDRR